MARLSTLAALLALMAAVSARADPPQGNSVARWAPLIEPAATRCRVPAPWIERVMRAESAGQTMLGGRPITSRAGAMGLMQLMPATWAEMRGLLALGPDPHDPADNIVAGACYLRLMYDRFGYPGLFGAYNAGPGRYAAWLAGTGTLPGETRAYLASVTSGQTAVGREAEPPAAPSLPPIFIALRTVTTEPRHARTGAPTSEAGQGLFLIRR